MLIGIIGVILFIGLALAGAVILGSDFLTASSASKAAAVVQGLQQASNGYALNTLRTGSPIGSDQGATVIQILITNRRLKTAPVVPVGTGSQVVGYDDIGQRNAARPMGTLIMELGPLGTRSLRDVCYAIEEQMGSPNPSAGVDNAIGFDTKVTTDRRVGCMLNSYSGTYAAYVTL